MWCIILDVLRNVYLSSCLGFHCRLLPIYCFFSILKFSFGCELFVIVNEYTSLLVFFIIVLSFADCSVLFEFHFFFVSLEDFVTIRNVLT